MSKFIKSFVGKNKENIIEIGSGNSSLLYNLNYEKIVNHGVGIEIAKSRYLFAEKWKNDLGFGNISNINNDFRNIPIEENILILNCRIVYY